MALLSALAARLVLAGKNGVTLNPGGCLSWVVVGLLAG
jgi:hypothetical protein